MPLLKCGDRDPGKIHHVYSACTLLSKVFDTQDLELMEMM